MLFRSIHRSRVTLVRAATEEISGREVGRFLSRGLVDTIRQSKVPLVAGQAEQRDVAVIMLDIRSFTPFAAAAGPQRTVEVLTSLHDLVLPIAWKQGGVVDKFLGDGIMLTFGAISPLPDAARRGLTAFVEIMQATAPWETVQGLRVNGAATYGEVVFATLGSADRLEYTVIGEPVNLAAKLEQHNKVAGCRGLVTRALVEAADQQGEPANWPLADLGPCAVAGVTGGIELQRVVARG